MNAISLGHLPMIVHVVRRSIFWHAPERISLVAMGIVSGRETQIPETSHLDVVAQPRDLEYEQVAHERAQRPMSSDNVTWLKNSAVK